jgi:hypothetical protein
MPTANPVPKQLSNICNKTSPTPVRVPFSADTPEPVLVQLGQYFYFEAPDTPGTVHITCDKNPTIFEPQLAPVDIPAHGRSPWSYCPVKANQTCLVTTSYNFGVPMSVGRTIHISKEDLHSFPFFPYASGALLLVLLVGVILWMLPKPPGPDPSALRTNPD